jgi:SAM-dependent methyltransferase
VDCLDFRSGSQPVSGRVSFRDPGGQVIIKGERAFRLVTDKECQHFVTAFLSGDLFAALVHDGMLVSTQYVLDPSLKEELSCLAITQSPEAMVLEHEYIGFPSYPYEWPPQMLYAAGELTLRLMGTLLSEGLGLKDASPYNILYRGPRPIFVDLLSIEQRQPADPTWIAYAQFTRAFIRPLLAARYFGIGLDQTFRVFRDGLRPEQLFQMCGLWRKFYRPFLTSVSFPTWLSRLSAARSPEIYRKRKASSPEQASFILSRQLKGLRRELDAGKPNAASESTWTRYDECKHKTKEYLDTKTNFVRTAIEERRPKKLLDVGCNLGYFSFLAAQAGCSVVAIDQDSVAVGRVWQHAFDRNLPILPLVIDITRPTPRLGWRNQESRGFLDRALGAFDCVLMLAVVHHMLVTERIPLAEILKLASELTTDMLIIEFVPPDDDMFRSLARGNGNLYQYLTRGFFEAACHEHFIIEKQEKLEDSNRWLYQLRKTGLA